MQIIGVDLHTRQQTVAMLNVETGEVIEKTLRHEGDSVPEFYSTLAGPSGVGIEATGSMQWFLELMEELGIDCQVGHPAKIRAAEPRKQKHEFDDMSATKARTVSTVLGRRSPISQRYSMKFG
jgi:hypothetical protein